MVSTELMTRTRGRLMTAPWSTPAGIVIIIVIYYLLLLLLLGTPTQGPIADVAILRLWATTWFTGLQVFFYYYCYFFIFLFNSIVIIIIICYYHCYY